MINEVINYSNSLNYYYRKSSKLEKENIYYIIKYNFILKKSTINNILNTCKESSIKFTKYPALEMPLDNENELFLREKSEYIEIEYFIWCSNINISYIRKSKYIIIVVTYHIPYTFCQCLILIYNYF